MSEDYKDTLDVTEICRKLEERVVDSYEARDTEGRKIYMQDVARRNLEALRLFYQKLSDAIELSPPCGREARWWMPDLIKIRDEALTRLRALNALLVLMKEKPDYKPTSEDEALL